MLTDALSLDALSLGPCIVSYTPATHARCSRTPCRWTPSRRRPATPPCLRWVTTPTVLFSLPPHFPDAHPPSLTLPSYQYFKKTFGTSPERLLAAKRNFAASLAAYSLFSYILQVPTADVATYLYLLPLSPHSLSHLSLRSRTGTTATC